MGEHCAGTTTGALCPAFGQGMSACLAPSLAPQSETTPAPELALWGRRARLPAPQNQAGSIQSPVKASREGGEGQPCAFLAAKPHGKTSWVCREQVGVDEWRRRIKKNKTQGKVGAPRRQRQRSLLFLTFTDAANAAVCERFYPGESVQANRRLAYTEYICKAGGRGCPWCWLPLPAQ